MPPMPPRRRHYCRHAIIHNRLLIELPLRHHISTELLAMPRRALMAITIYRSIITPRHFRFIVERVLLPSAPAPRRLYYAFIIAMPRLPPCQRTLTTDPFLLITPCRCRRETPCRAERRFSPPCQLPCRH